MRHKHRSRLVTAGLVLSALAAAVLSFLALTENHSLTPEVAAGEPSEPAVLLVAGGALDPAVAGELARGLSPAGRSVVHDGAGFHAGGALSRLVVEDIGEDPPRAFVVQGGELDVGLPPATVETAALHMIDRLRVTVRPETSLTVIGPVPDGEPDGALLLVRDALAVAAKQKLVHFIDPIALGLQQGSPDLAALLAEQVRPFVPG